MHSSSHTFLAFPLVTLICSAMLLITVITSSGSLVTYRGEESGSHFESHIARVLGEAVSASSSERM